MILDESMKQIQKTFFALGTANTISIGYPKDEEEHVTEVLERCKTYVLQMDDRLSVFKENSEISKVNHAAGIEAVTVSEDTFRIIERAIYFSKLSHGAFDISAGALSKVWSIGKKGDYIPEEQKIKEAQDVISYESIFLNADIFSVSLAKTGQSIDLGGIAKGYAVDAVHQILVSAGIKDAVINFGGTVLAIGKERRIGIRSPFDKKCNIGSLVMKDTAVVTSGVYERYFLKDGVRYHHILDPKTGHPADMGICSATLTGNSAMDMDALATIFILLGLEKGVAIMKQCGAEGIFITDAGDIFVSEGISSHFTIEQPIKNEGTERVGNSYER